MLPNNNLVVIQKAINNYITRKIMFHFFVLYGKHVITKCTAKQPSDTYISNEPTDSFDLAYPGNNFF